MDLIRRLRPSGLPLALQIMALLLGVLVIAQLVTLFLTIILPPEPPAQHSMVDIARALSGAVVQRDGEQPLQQQVRNGPPAPSGPGWLVSERSRHELARLLQRDDADVLLYFHAPLPFGGNAMPLPHAVMQYRMAPERRAANGIRLLSARLLDDADSARLFLPIDFQVAQAVPVPYGFPGSQMPPVTTSPAMPSGPAPAGERLPSGIAPSPVQSAPFPGESLVPHDSPPVAPASPIIPGPPAPGLPAPELKHVAPAVPLQIFPERASAASPFQESVPRPARPMTRSRAPQRPTESLPAEPAPPALNPDRMTPPGFAVPLRPPRRGLFGLAPVPFVEGDFVAALKISDGHWAVVQPQPEPFPDNWQRRVLLWFLISFALVAPLGLLFARRLVRPIAGFATAAERLGRDPRAPVLAQEGPTEVGRAAHAFNRMQSRLRSFVDDRTAMIGAISHDLRTPLTRLRFRVEDVPEPLRTGILAEINEMEEMIKSVLNFIRDASEPGARERLDLRAIVEDVVEDAVFVGRRVTLEDSGQAPVEVDPLGMRRLFGNLLENAVKYGERAEVRLFTDNQDAIAEIRDHGPGLPEDELEQVFKPFYRTAAARASKAEGCGLGLAVCRSIARAHGGDVQLKSSAQGLVAQVRLPLAYGMTQS